MVPDEPLFFHSIFRSYIWGGNRLKTFLNKSVPNDGVWAESWEIVDHGEDQSQVSNGVWKDWTLRKLIETFPESIVGKNANSQTGFPLLLKYLDCQRVLSVQVHPDDFYAAKMIQPDLGKTEAWYVVDATEDALLYAGLKKGVERSDLMQAVKDGRTEECLHSFHPNVGDCIFIPAGTLHALGGGLVVAEIQQASDTTFRLFDWNRVGNDGQPRPLHIEQALEVTDFETGPVSAVYPQPLTGQSGRMLVDCDKFRLIELDESTEVQTNGKFKIITVVKGTGKLTWSTGESLLQLGQSVLIPAACETVNLQLGSNTIALIAS